MDFGMIAKKLNEGSYQTLEKFEQDVFLVPNNVILFNASNTIYYRQARALKELATKLFHALKTDPKSFEFEASLQRMGLGRRTNAGVGILNCYRAHGRFNDVDVERRQTSRPWKYLLSENGSLVSAVYNSSKPLVLDSLTGGNPIAGRQPSTATNLTAGHRRRWPKNSKFPQIIDPSISTSTVARMGAWKLRWQFCFLGSVDGFIAITGACFGPDNRAKFGESPNLKCVELKVEQILLIINFFFLFI
ncbi:hypothetical protein F3Y22_tig00116989pilonHSYRG00233 [Hibiscus syriacus]|uniref:Bromo domain-containing protein n=1 Tax=Hibiscus syriacus TaxID=106335 RepID=A0A6A2WP40_HIBSY|nr:hypothetical protein F3Y22_tig00116989pilonHSYRG00233 [Hibiscus syriacus]